MKKKLDCTLASSREFSSSKVRSRTGWEFPPSISMKTMDEGHQSLDEPIDAIPIEGRESEISSCILVRVGAGLLFIQSVV